MIFKKNTTHLLIFLSILITSCDDVKELPKGLIEKSSFTQILLETQLVEAHLNEVRIEQVYIRDSAGYYFEEVFKKNNVTLEGFKTTMDYYTTRPGELQEIYNNVLDKLSAMEAELVDVKLNEETISPLGKHQIADIIIQTPVSKLYFDTSYTTSQIKDSLFKYLIKNKSILDAKKTNLSSFQKSYIGITYKAPMYNSLKEEIRTKMERLR